jgi:hypothetical protein
MAAFAICFGLGTAARFAAGEAIQLGIEAASREFRFGFNLLAAFPPVALLWGLRHRLGAGLGLRDLSPLTGFLRV